MSNKRLQGMVSEGHILFVIAFPEEGKEGDEYLRILNEIVNIESTWGGQGGNTNKSVD